MRKIIATILVSLSLMLGITGSATAGTEAGRSGTIDSVSVCDAGHRGQKSYDAKCLRTGTVLDGVNLWFRYIDGGAVSKADRKAFCKDATATGHTRAGIMDGLFDVAYDNYRNHKFVLSIAGTVGVWDCQALGVKIKK